MSALDQKNYSVLLWSFSLIGYLFYELFTVLTIEIVDETKKG
jgi:hypothetical protein